MDRSKTYQAIFNVARLVGIKPDSAKRLAEAAVRESSTQTTAKLPASPTRQTTAKLPASPTRQGSGQPGLVPRGVGRLRIDGYAGTFELKEYKFDTKREEIDVTSYGDQSTVIIPGLPSVTSLTTNLRISDAEQAMGPAGRGPLDFLYALPGILAVPATASLLGARNVGLQIRLHNSRCYEMEAYATDVTQYRDLSTGDTAVDIEWNVQGPVVT